MTSNPAERLWSQSVDDGNYDVTITTPAEIYTDPVEPTGQQRKIGNFLSKLIEVASLPDLPAGPMSRRVSEDDYRV